MNTEIRKLQEDFFNSDVRAMTMNDIVWVQYDVCYIAPDSDEDYIIACLPQIGIAVKTNFYDCGDFFTGSDYNYVYKDGIIQPGV